MANKNYIKPFVVILLAGMGSRLGKSYPKSMAPLGNGETILSRQARIIKSFDLDICCVVGFKKDLIMEAVPDSLFVYNERYDVTNTSKSLLCAIKHVYDRDVIWLNGDVVFTQQLFSQIINTDDSVVAVNNAKVSEEEIKYTIGEDGFINAISKKVENANGEALGINKIKSVHLNDFKKYLESVDDNDYFEKAMELSISQGKKIFKPLDVSEYGCIEVDFESDLKNAIAMLSRNSD